MNSSKIKDNGGVTAIPVQTYRYTQTIKSAIDGTYTFDGQLNSLFSFYLFTIYLRCLLVLSLFRVAFL